MDELDKIFEDFDEEEFNDPEWKVIMIGNYYYILTEIMINENVGDKYIYTLNDNYKYSSPIDYSNYIEPSKLNSDLNIYYDANKSDTCRIDELDDNIREKLGLPKNI